MTETLTKAQKAAVEDRGGPLLVAAAADPANQGIGDG